MKRKKLLAFLLAACLVVPNSFVAQAAEVNPTEQTQNLEETKEAEPKEETVSDEKKTEEKKQDSDSKDEFEKEDSDQKDTEQEETDQKKTDQKDLENKNEKSENSENGGVTSLLFENLAQLPAVASIWNAETELYDTYTALEGDKGAIANAKDGDTILMNGEYQNEDGYKMVTLSEPVTVSGKSITLELNGVTITTNTNRNVPITITTGGSLTVQDSTAKQSVAEDNKTVKYEGGKIENNAGKVATIQVKEGGTFILKSGQISGVWGIDATGTDTNVRIEGGYLNALDYGVDVYQNAKVTVAGGVLESLLPLMGAENEAANTATQINMEGGNLIAHVTPEEDEMSAGILYMQIGSVNISGGTIYAENGMGVFLYNGTLSMTGGTIITSGSISSNEEDIELKPYGVWLFAENVHVDEDEDEKNIFYGIIEGGTIIAPDDVEAVKTTYEGKCSQEIPGSLIIKKAAEGFFPAFSSKVDENYCYAENDATDEKRQLVYLPTDNRKGNEGVDDKAPYSVDERTAITLAIPYDGYPEDPDDVGTVDLYGARGNALTDEDKNNLNACETMKSDEEDKIYVFLGWYERETGEKADLNVDSLVYPDTDMTYVAKFVKVDKGSATGQADLQGTALPTDTSKEAVQTALDSMSKTAGEAAQTLADAVEKKDEESILVNLTVNADKKQKEEVETDAELLLKEAKIGEKIQGYYDISVLQTTYKTTLEEANTNALPLTAKTTSESQPVTSLDKPIQVTLDVSDLKLSDQHIRVAHVHNGQVKDLDYTYDETNGLLTVSMKEFSTVAILTAGPTAVTFDSMGGSAVAGSKVAYGEKVTKPADPTRTGYKFAGWYTDSAYTKAYAFDTAMTGEETMTLYAKWEAEQKDTDKNTDKNTDKDTNKDTNKNTDKNTDQKNSGSNGSSSGSSGSSSSSSGSGSSASSVSSAKTADTANLALWMALLLLAGIGTAGTLVYDKKKK